LNHRVSGFKVAPFVAEHKTLWVECSCQFLPLIYVSIVPCADNIDSLLLGLSKQILHGRTFTISAEVGVPKDTLIRHCGAQ